MYSSSRDNWQRLVEAAMKREQYLELAHKPYSRSPSVSASDSDRDLESINASPSPHQVPLRERPPVAQVNKNASSVMLKKLLASDAANQIMSSEISCEVNQLLVPSHLICVNGKPLSPEELVMLRSCPNPPKKLKPGKYWYDKVSGFWGKEGEKPSQIISAEMAIGYQMSEDASNGDTNVLINCRVITKAELWMLKVAGIDPGRNMSWLAADGSCQHEGMNNVLCHLWSKRRVKIVCALLSLPFPDTSILKGAKAVARNAGH